jgi:hypothetical protein
VAAPRSKHMDIDSNTNGQRQGGQTKSYPSVPSGKSLAVSLREITARMQSLQKVLRDCAEVGRKYMECAAPAFELGQLLCGVSESKQENEQTPPSNVALKANQTIIPGSGNSCPAAESQTEAKLSNRLTDESLQKRKLYIRAKLYDLLDRAKIPRLGTLEPGNVPGEYRAEFLSLLRELILLSGFSVEQKTWSRLTHKKFSQINSREWYESGIPGFLQREMRNEYQRRKLAARRKRQVKQWNP